MTNFLTVYIFCVGLVVSIEAGSSQFNYKDYYNWWGPDETKNNTNTTIRPFKITFDDDMISDLQYRLRNHAILTEPLKDSAFNYGVNTNYLRNFSKYWAEEYPFKEREAYLNQFPQFKTNIQGLDIHFIRYRTNSNRTNTTVYPMLILHGWPGSCREFYSALLVMEELCQDKHFDFDFVVPSLPGFGFSDAAVIQGLGANEASVMMRNLMNRLGFTRYYVQGGDWGSIVGSIMAVLFPDEIIGYHSNFPLAFTLTSLATYIYGIYNQDSVVDKSLADRMYPATTMISHYLQETGYLHIQSAKPDTLGAALSDSPIGSLAWYLTAISSEDPNNIALDDGGVENNLSREDIIDNIMLYWAPRKVTTSMRFYAESINKKSLGSGLQTATIILPTYAIQAKYELAFMTETMLRSRFLNLVNVTIWDNGTHFLAWEFPNFFAQSIIDAVTKIEALNAAASTCVDV